MQTAEPGASYNNHSPNGLRLLLLLQTYKERQKKDYFCAENFSNGDILIFEKNGRKTSCFSFYFLAKKSDVN